MSSAPDTAVGALDVSTYTIPTDAPEGDGTLSWTSTTLVLVKATAADQVGLGWTYGPAAWGALSAKGWGQGRAGTGRSWRQ